MNELNIKQLVLGMFRTNCYIVYNDEKEAFIVDPGEGYRKVKDTILEMGLIPKAVLLTHGHFDHMAAAADIKREFDAKIYAYKDENVVLSQPAYNLSQNYGEPIALKADIELEDEEDIEIAGYKIKVIHTPGHTIGSCCFLLLNYGVLLSGDTLFLETHGRYDFPTGSGREILSSIIDKLLVLPDETVVLPGHNDSTTIGDEKKWYR